MVTAVFFAETKGAISLMVKNDISHLTIVIMVLYVIVSVVVGKLCFLSDKINKGREKEARRHLTKRAMRRNSDEPQRRNRNK